MSKFKIGDKVLLREDSEWNNGHKTNPIDCVGVIVGAYNCTGFNFDVEWVNGETNSYYQSDLKPAKQFTKSDLKDGMRVFFSEDEFDWYPCSNADVLYCPETDSQMRIGDLDFDAIKKVIGRDGTVLFEREEEISVEDALEELLCAIDLNIDIEHVSEPFEEAIKKAKKALEKTNETI